MWVLDGSDFPKQGRKSVGVARQYCGRLGKVANCQAGMFLAYVSPLGRALVDKGLYLPESWTSDKDRCDQKLQQQQRGTVCPLQVVNYVNQGLNESGVSEEHSNRFK